MTFTIVMLRVLGQPTAAELPNDLRAMQDAVGGYLEALHWNLEGHELLVYCNEEGRLLGLKHNRHLPNLLGDVFVAAADAEGENRSLTPEEVRSVLQHVARGAVFEPQGAGR